MENQPEQPIKPPSSSTTWVALVIVVLILLIGGYFLFFQEEETATANINTVVITNATVNKNTNTLANTNSNVDTGDWQVYTNEEYGFSFRYPSSLGSTVGEYLPPYPNTIFNGNTVQVAGISAANADSFIQVYVVNDTLENVKEDINTREFVNSNKVAEWQSFQLDSILAEYAQKSVNLDNDYFRNIYVFKKDNLVYVIYTFTNLGESDTAISTFEIK